MLSLLQPILQESNSFGLLCWGVILIIIVGIVVLINIAIADNKATKQKLEELQSIESISVGKGITGLTNLKETDIAVLCSVTQNDLVFLRSNAEEIGRIPRDSINQIIVDDKSQITQHITVGRILTLGIFALAAPKTSKQLNFYLLIDWNNEDGTVENTVFEFSGANSNVLANNAINALKKHIKPKVERLKNDEKKCQFCAEIVKKEAKVCKHCGRDLT